MKKTLSLKTKTILFFIIALIGIGFLLAAGSAIYLNILKEHIVSDALKLAQEQGEHAAKEIHRLIEEQNLSSLNDLKQNRHLQSQLQVLLKKNKEIVIAAFIDNSGKIVVENLRKGEDGIEVIEPSKPHSTNIPVKKDEDWEIEVKKLPDNLQQIEIPIKKGDVSLGTLKYSISQSKVFQKITKTSKRFSYHVMLILSSLLVMLSAIFYLLWKAVNRHIRVLEEKEKLDKMAYVGTLASGLAHEIRNPLNVMKINLDVISEDMANNSQNADTQSEPLIKLIAGQVEHLNGVLNSFLNFAISHPPVKESTDIVSLIKETIELFEIENKRLLVECMLDAPDPVVAEVDAGKIRQVVMNILINALQAMTGEEKKIFVNVHKKESGAIITITDTGSGFPEDKIDECFNVFFTTKEHGSGFGLAIAKKIIEEHGGTIFAGNVSPHGARITISLPLSGTGKMPMLLL